MPQQPSHLAWLDLEMTGLNPDDDTILEIATLVTDNALNIIAVGPNLAIHQPDHILEHMDPWCIKHHGSSGLTQRVQDSKVSMAEAEKQTISFLKGHLAAGASPLCGNSIGQDRRFLYRHMPQLEAFFHYRNLDVSTVKELARRWAPDVFKGFKKHANHLALDDIRESVGELKYYMEHFFVMGGSLDTDSQ